MSPKCPACGSVIYSRRNVLCGVCGQRLPPELLFTPEEREAVEHDLDELKRRTHEVTSDKPASPSAFDHWFVKRSNPTTRRSLFPYGGIAAVLVFGLGNLIVAFSLPPEKHQLALALTHRGVIALVLVAAVGVIGWLVRRFID